MVDAFLTIFDSVTVEYGLLVFVLFALCVFLSVAVIFLAIFTRFLIKKYIEHAAENTEVFTKMEISMAANNKKLDGVSTSLKVIEGFFSILMASGKIDTPRGNDGNS